MPKLLIAKCSRFHRHCLVSIHKLLFFEVCMYVRMYVRNIRMYVILCVCVLAQHTFKSFGTYICGDASEM